MEQLGCWHKILHVSLGDRGTWVATIRELELTEDAARANLLHLSEGECHGAEAG